MQEFGFSPWLTTFLTISVIALNLCNVVLYFLWEKFATCTRNLIKNGVSGNPLAVPGRGGLIRWQAPLSPIH